MARRFLETPLPSSQKGKNSHFPPTQKKLSSSPRSRCSTHTQRSLSTSCSQLPSSPPHAFNEMKIIITSALKKWLTDHGLMRFIQVAEAVAHRNAMEMASKLNIDTLTNSMVRRKLGLNNMGERHFDIFPTEVLERYYGEYSQSAKAYRTRDIPDPFFCDIAKFLLEVGCVHLNAYGMPKQKMGVVISMFKGYDVYWGIITGTACGKGSMPSREERSSGRSFNSVSQYYFPLARHLLR